MVVEYFNRFCVQVFRRFDHVERSDSDSNSLSAISNTIWASNPNCAGLGACRPGPKR
jgi:hypothetical protein